ncbi:MAG: hypothetical protein AAB599_02680 [Patescibacteria group bacterium]
MTQLPSNPVAQKKILVLVGGGTKHISPFKEAGDRLGVEVVIGSFGNLNYKLEHRQRLFCGDQDIADFDVLYFRLVGRRAEDASLVAEYAKKHKVRVVDSIYQKGYSFLPLKKSQEMMVLAENNIPLPKTVFGSLKYLVDEAPSVLGFPLVVKGSYGKQGHAVWLIRDSAELAELYTELRGKEKEGKRFFAQEFVKITERTRVFVLGDRVIGSIVLRAKWRKYVESLDISYLIRPGLADGDSYELAVKAARTLGIEVAGVDLIQDIFSGKVYVLEVNSAPRWVRFKRETGINVEKEIVKYLSSL